MQRTFVSFEIWQKNLFAMYGFDVQILHLLVTGCSLVNALKQLSMQTILSSGPAFFTG